MWYRNWINKDDHYKSEQEDSHHVLAKSRWGANGQENRIKIYHKVHQALHALFSNATPTEQIETLIKINQKALSDDFLHDMNEIISVDDPDYYYKKGIWVRKDWSINP